MSDISVKGVVLNLLSVGFSTIASICEFIDNSLGAKASEINIRLTNNHFTYWDNGEGMNIEKLKEGHIIANRSELSTTKHGRFGVGDKHAKAHLTQLLSKTLTFSKTVACEEDEISQVEADWPSIIEKNEYLVTATDITCRNKPVWDNNVGNLKCGTLQYLECHKKIAREIKDNIETNQINSSYLYSLGVSYYNDLVGDFRIKIDINGLKYDVIPIDPLEWNKIPEINKKETTIDVMSNDNNIVLLLSLDGEEGFYEIYIDKAGRKHSRFYSLNDIKSLQDQTAKEIKESDQKINGKKFSGYPINKTFLKEDYEKISNITCRSAYHPDWTELQSYVYEHIGEPLNHESDIEDVSDNTPSENEKKKNQDTFNYMGGEYYTRNGRRIKRFDTEQPKRGDKARYPFQTNSRHEIMFTAEIDDKMGVLVNKSDLKRELILSSFSTIFEVLKKQFIDKQYKLSIKTVNPVKSQIKQPQNVTKSTIDVSIIDSIETTQIPQIISNGNESKNIISSFVEEDEEEIVAENTYTNEILLEAKIVSVGPKNDTTITINQGKQIIKKWFDTGSKNDELEHILNEMIKKYQDKSAPDQIDLILSEVTLTQKCNIINKSIHFRYPNESVYDTTNMLFGAELWRSYTDTFP